MLCLTLHSDNAVLLTDGTRSAVLRAGIDADQFGVTRQAYVSVAPQAIVVLNREGRSSQLVRPADDPLTMGRVGLGVGLPPEAPVHVVEDIRHADRIAVIFPDGPAWTVIFDQSSPLTEFSAIRVHFSLPDWVTITRSGRGLLPMTLARPEMAGVGA